MKAKEIYKRIEKVCVKCSKSYRVFPFRIESKYCSRQCGAGNSLKGKKLTKEHKLALLEGKKKYIYTPEVKAKMSAIKKNHIPWNKGKADVYSEETRKAMASNKGMYGNKSHNWKGGLNPMWVRKQRIRVNGGSHTKEQWETLKAQYNWTCPSCKRKEPDIKLTEDHVISLKKGGSENIENIQPLCRSCNSKKHTKVVKYEVIFRQR